MRTFIIAPDLRRAKYEAHERGLNPRDHDVILVTNENHLRGYRVNGDDRVIVAGVPKQDVMEQLAICRSRGA